MYHEIFNAIFETLIMLIIPGLCAIMVGGFVGIMLFILNPASKFALYHNRSLYNILSFIVNVTRSLPFVILMIAVIPLTRILVGTSIGTLAACVPLSLAAIPFFARIMESAMLTVNQGLIEAGLAMGANNFTILRRIIIREARYHIIAGITLMLISLLGYTAMAGIIGGGGIGAISYNYGYLRFNNAIMLLTIVIMIIIVQIIQMLNNYFLTKLKY